MTGGPPHARSIHENHSPSFPPSHASASVPARAATETGLRIASFRFDVTPPVGHPLLGGYLKPVLDHADALEAVGYVLLGAGNPIVMCAVDWAYLMSEAHLAWRAALADAVGTTPERVAVQCVHQHNAPSVCLVAARLVAAQQDGLSIVQMEFFDTCLARARAAVKTALPLARPVTHIAHVEGRVEKVASNRRVALGPDGKVRKMRGSSCRDAALIALPDGLLIRCSRPSASTAAARSSSPAALRRASDEQLRWRACEQRFSGLARKRRQKEEPGCAHLYFTGCAGDIAAGKYNPGTPEARVQLTQRIYDGIVAAEKSLQRVPAGRVTWKTHDLLPEVNPVFTVAKQREMFANKANAPANRIRPAMRLAWIDASRNACPSC